MENEPRLTKIAEDSTVSVEGEIKILQKHMGAALMTIKDLKVTIKALEKRISERENEEIKEMFEKQKVVEEVLAANKEEIEKMKQANKEQEASKDATNHVYSDKGTANKKIQID